MNSMNTMNSYFSQNPFLQSLQGDGQGPLVNGGGGGGGCNYGRGMYDQNQYMGGCGGPGQGMAIVGGGAGQYGTHSPPGAHPAVSEPMVSRHQDLNGYDNGQTHLGGPPPPHQGWGMPQGAQHSPTDYPQTQLPDPQQQQGYLPTTSTPSSTPSIPFYPWMGVVGKHKLFYIFYYFNFPSLTIKT
jgi:hypothetical protein